MTDPKVIALATHLNTTPDNIQECAYGDDLYVCGSDPGEYRVMTDREADAAADEYLESYIDSFILPAIPDAFRGYFDHAAWKRDALISDGRGHLLASYDDAEHDVQIDGEWYYIYRVN